MRLFTWKLERNLFFFLFSQTTLWIHQILRKSFSFKQGSYNGPKEVYFYFSKTWGVLAPKLILYFKIVIIINTGQHKQQSYRTIYLLISRYRYRQKNLIQLFSRVDQRMYQEKKKDTNESQKQCKYIGKKQGEVTQHSMWKIVKKAIKIPSLSKSEAFLQRVENFVNKTYNGKL